MRAAGTGGDSPRDPAAARAVAGIAAKAKEGWAMSETVHPWCRNTARDEAIRMAEDAAAAERTPLPDHRDLPSVVHELRRRVEGLEAVADAWRRQCEAEAENREAAPVSRDGVTAAPVSRAAETEPTRPFPVPPADGLRTERVTLEVAIRDGRQFGPQLDGVCGVVADYIGVSRQRGESVRVVEDADAASDEAIAHGATLNALAEARKSLAAANRGIDRLTAERDAALRHIAATEQSRRDAIRERDAAKADLDGAMRGCVRLNNDLAALRGRVAELESAPAANAGGEAKQPQPMAFAVWGRGAVCGVTVSREDAGAMQREFAFDTEVMPLFAAPQPPRGWLTSEERKAVGDAATALHQLSHYNLSLALRAIQARSTPPRVKVPVVVNGFTHREHAEGWVKAIREAGGEVE